MARIRTIKPSFWTDEDLGEVSLEAHHIAGGLINQVDSEGRMEVRPKSLKLAVSPFRDINVMACLVELASIGYVTQYAVDGKSYLQINGFRKHQRISGKEAGTPSELPPPPPSGGGIGRSGFPNASPVLPDEFPVVLEGKGREEEGKGMDAHEGASPSISSDSSSTTTGSETPLVEGLDATAPEVAPRQVSSSVLLHRSLTYAQRAEGWDFTNDDMARIAQAGEALGVLAHELPGKIALTLMNPPKGGKEDGAYEAWFALAPSAVAEWLEAAVITAAQRGSLNVYYVAGVIRGRLTAGGKDKPGTVVPFAPPSQPAAPAAPPEMTSRPWWSTLQSVAKTPATPSMVDVMNLAHALGLRELDDAAALKLGTDGAIATCDWLWASQKQQQTG